MILPRRYVLKMAGAAAAAPALPRVAAALDYPTHSVRIVVGFPPGGPSRPPQDLAAMEEEG